ncbi:MAG: hypothetical protein EXR57_01950 [Dehalococcoidia bacterium]|nr:hypothetical protein [Dehalococcoidia bacterium]
MKFIVRVILTLSAAAVLSGLPALPSASAQSLIGGHVVSGTAGLKLAPGVQVALQTVDTSAGRIIATKTASTDADGRFVFQGDLESGSNLSFFLVANVASGLYAQEVDLASAKDKSGVEIKVFETTTSLENIHVTSYVMLVPTIDAQTRLLGVLTVADIQNTGDRVLLVDPSKPGITGLELVRFSLPEGFRDLAVESDLPVGNTLEIGTGFAITNPVPPGEFKLLMSYVVPYEGDSVVFPLKLPFGSDFVRVLLPEKQGRLTGDGMGAPQSVTIGEGIYASMEGKDYQRNTTLNIVLADLPQPALMQKIENFFDGRTYVLILIWAVAVLMIGLLAYAFIASRKRSKVALAVAPEGAPVVGGPAPGVTVDVAAPSASPVAPGSERQRIVAEIAGLDDRHADGKVPEAEYQARREELKQQALKAGR